MSTTGGHFLLSKKIFKKKRLQKRLSTNWSKRHFSGLTAVIKEELIKEELDCIHQICHRDTGS